MYITVLNAKITLFLSFSCQARPGIWDAACFELRNMDVFSYQMVYCRSITDTKDVFLYLVAAGPSKQCLVHIRVRDRPRAQGSEWPIGFACGFPKIEHEICNATILTSPKNKYLPSNDSRNKYLVYLLFTHSSPFIINSNVSERKNRLNCCLTVAMYLLLGSTQKNDNGHDIAEGT